MKKNAKKLSGILFALLLALSFTAYGCDDYSDTNESGIYTPSDSGDGGTGGGGIGEGC